MSFWFGCLVSISMLNVKWECKCVRKLQLNAPKTKFTTILSYIQYWGFSGIAKGNYEASKNSYKLQTICHVAGSNISVKHRQYIYKTTQFALNSENRQLYFYGGQHIRLMGLLLDIWINILGKHFKSNGIKLFINESYSFLVSCLSKSQKFN